MANQKQPRLYADIVISAHHINNSSSSASNALNDSGEGSAAQGIVVAKLPRDFLTT
jgi:hypothetical protein